MNITVDMLVKLTGAQLNVLGTSRGTSGKNKLVKAQNILNKSGLKKKELVVIAMDNNLTQGGSKNVLIERIWPDEAAEAESVSDFEEMTELEASQLFQQMTRVDIELNKLFLDPANPRFHKQKKVEDPEISNDTNQKHCTDQIEVEGGYVDLETKMLKFGFVDHESPYVRPIEGSDPPEYVVLEGNRRTACAKHIVEEFIEPGIDIDDKPENWKESFSSMNCQVYNGERADIAWIIQGFRHNGGVKDWHPVRRAKFFVMRMEADGVTARELQDSLGLTESVSAMVKSYRMLQSANSIVDTAKKFPEADSEKSYGWFAEGVNKSPRLKDWLGWNDVERKFTKKDNVKAFRDMVLGPKKQFAVGQKRLSVVSKKLINEGGTPSVYWQQMVDDEDVNLEQANTSFDVAAATSVQQAQLASKTLTDQTEVLSEAIGHLRAPVLGGDDGLGAIDAARALTIRQLLDDIDAGVLIWRRQVDTQHAPAP